MKKIKYLLLILLVLPINTKAERYYTEYEPYILENKEKVDTSDLIKEEAVNYYYKDEMVRYNESYLPAGTISSLHPFIDYSQKKIVGKIEKYGRTQSDIIGKVYSTNLANVNSITIIGLSYIPNFTIYDKLYNELEYTVDGQVITLAKSIKIDNLILLMNENKNINFTLSFNGGVQFYVSYIKNITNQYEINFVLKDQMINKLLGMGHETTNPNSSYEYAILYTYHYLHYNNKIIEKKYPDEVEGYKRIETLYNYYKRDYIDIKEYLVTDKPIDQNEIINSTSLSEKDIKLKSDINYDKNGIYPVVISIPKHKLTSLVVVLKDVEIEENTCPKVEKCEPVIIEKVVKEDPIIVEKIIKEDPVIIEKIIKEESICEPIIIEKPFKQTKYVNKYIESECKEEKPINSIITKVKEPVYKKEKIIEPEEQKFKIAYILPAFPIVVGIILLKRKRNL